MRADRRRLEELVKLLNDMLPKDVIIFKGGLFLGEYTGVFRGTQDIDMSIVDKSLYSLIVPVLQLYGEMLEAEGAVASIEISEEVQDHMSGGVTYRDAAGNPVLSVDVSYCNPVLDSVVLSTKRFGEIRISSLNQMLSDKVRVLYSKSRFRRVKDLYDIWQAVDAGVADAAGVRSLLKKIGEYPLPEDKSPFEEERMKQLQHAYEKFRLWSVDGTELDKPDFWDVIQAVGNFMIKVNEV